MLAKTKNTTTAAGIAGAVIGAGITAAAVALSDAKTRKKVVKTFNDATKQARSLMENVAPQAEHVKEDAKDILKEQKHDLQEAKVDAVNELKKL